MGFWDFMKRNKDHTEDRTLKEPDLSEFVVPVFVNPKPIRKTDEMLVQQLKQEFIESGVINYETSEENEQDTLTDDDADSLIELFEEVNSHAKNEKDFHGDVYFDEGLYKELDIHEENIVFDDDLQSFNDQLLNLTSNYDDDDELY